MIINEIFGSIDGEARRAGELATFVRTNGCCLKCSWCFGVKPGRHIPAVHLVNPNGRSKITARGNKKSGATLPINQVMVGDELFTYDDELNIVTTKVKGVIDREVTEWCEIVLGSNLYFVTPEHPVFTTRGMKLAKDLVVGDMVLHTDSMTLQSMRMKINNPMFNEASVEKVKMNTDRGLLSTKIAASIAERKLKGTYKPTWDLMSQEKKDEVCRKLSASKLREKNPNWVDNYRYRNYEDLKKSVRSNPDAFHCERCGIDGKTSKLFIHHVNGNHEDDAITNLAVVCSKCHNQIHERGYNFWTSTRADGKVSLAAVSRANGIEVVSIKYVDITKHPHYGKTYGPKPLHVYNVSCAPYNTYFLDTMWVHNCDSIYTWGGEVGMEMTPDEIVSKCKELGNRNITFTGGEPLIQKDSDELINKLVANNFDVSIETCGAVDWTNRDWFKDKTEGVWVCADYKMPSSGMTDRMLPLEKFATLRDKDVLKFVVGSKTELQLAYDVVTNIREKGAKCWVYLSPVFGMIEPKEIVEFMQEKKWQDKVRAQLQLHKFFWDPNKRGV